MGGCWYVMLRAVSGAGRAVAGAEQRSGLPHPWLVADHCLVCHHADTQHVNRAQDLVQRRQNARWRPLLAPARAQWRGEVTQVTLHQGVMLLPDVREGVFMHLSHTFSILKKPSVMHKEVGQFTEGIKIVDSENCIIFLLKTSINFRLLLLITRKVKSLHPLAK